MLDIKHKTIVRPKFGTYHFKMFKKDDEQDKSRINFRILEITHFAVDFYLNSMKNSDRILDCYYLLKTLQNTKQLTEESTRQTPLQGIF